MERQVLRAASVGAAMACDIVINYPLWIVAKRVGCRSLGAAASTQAVRRRRRALGVDRAYHHH